MASSCSPSPHQQQFCLRWNNHQSALVSVFDHLLQSEAFVDVTLAVEGLLLRAHKLVLSACSPYFQTVFAQHPAKHPIIILKDVRYQDLRALLDFMYKGEVAVDQDRLQAFLRLAESLKIRGLAEFCQEEAAVLHRDSASTRVFDSLASRSDPPRHLQAAPTAVELLPLSTQASQGPVRRSLADLSALDFSVPQALGLTGTTGQSSVPICRSNGSPGSSGTQSSKRPNSPPLQTYAHHRRKRGRPPRHSNPDYVGTSNSVHNSLHGSGSLSSTCKDVSGSPEFMEMNVDLLSMGVNVAHVSDTSSSTRQPTDSNNHDSSLAIHHDDEEEDTKVDVLSSSTKGALRRSTSPSPTATDRATPFDPTLLSADARPASDRVDGNGGASTGGVGGDPQPGTSHQHLLPLINSGLMLDVGGRRGARAAGKGGKRMRGRPRSQVQRMGDRSSELGDDLAGPSSSLTESPERGAGGGIGGNGGSNNTEQLQEMSIRGLNLFRYASVSEEGMYRCIPCEKDHVTRTFKNKYSFQRHAYLYHEGNQRKVFPCLVCGREFSRPDKLKHHLKTVHDYAVPREYSNAYYALP